MKRTSLKTDDLDKYLTEIGSYAMLSKEEEQQLLKAVHEKGPDCEEAERLVKHNLRFTIGVAIQYQHRGLTLEELLTIGAEGLRKAALTYDLDNDIPFIRHAVALMRQCILQAIESKK